MNEKLKFTPGPWIFEKECGVILQRSSKRIICEVDRSAVAGNKSHQGRSYADLRLLAAAPELLEALIACRAELFLKVSNEHGPKFARQYPEIVAAEAAIDKATGKTSEAA